MALIKIRSNPYDRKISFFEQKKEINDWSPICISNENSALRIVESEKTFLPFKAKEVLDTIVDNYYFGSQPVTVLFEGTDDEYTELEELCSFEEFIDKIKLEKSSLTLESANIILPEVREIFRTIQPIIRNCVKEDSDNIKKLDKVSDALDDIIPICIFGNYSSGKSSFINALIGNEILPSGGDPVTSKVFKIVKSNEPESSIIRLDYLGSSYEIRLIGSNVVFTNGKNCDLIEEIIKSLKESDEKESNFNMRLNTVLKIINGFEKKNKDKNVVGSLIELEVPFREKGILGKSHNKFVIFDTPGSNSASNVDHGAILAEAMDGFSNGIPVWLTVHESLDSVDNASLCDKVMNIEALDSCFTMVVINKADQANLPENGFDEEDISELLEYDAIEKMYSSGIFFISSIIGLGYKNDGFFNDKFYKRTYRKEKDLFDDEEDEDYTQLYHYNYMPSPMMKRMLDRAVQCNDLLYSNSGLYSIEEAIDEFASKYSAYNKCRMVHLFLNEIIDMAASYIEEEKNKTADDRSTVEHELDDNKKQLLDRLKQRSDNLTQQFLSLASVENASLLLDTDSIIHTKYDFAAMDSRYFDDNKEKQRYTEKEKSHKESFNAIFSHMREHVSDTISGNIQSVPVNAKGMFSDLLHDLKVYNESKEAITTLLREIESKSADELLKDVSYEYRRNLFAAKDIATKRLQQGWIDYSSQLKQKLVEAVTECDELTATQKNELEQVILEYEPLTFKDDSDDIFMKKRFLRNNYIGIHWKSTERLNIKKLTDSYNSRIKNSFKEIVDIINENCFMGYESWKENLLSLIQRNVTQYNPTLREMANRIQQADIKIEGYKKDKKSLTDALDAINQMMSWKDEGVID